MPAAFTWFDQALSASALLWKPADEFKNLRQIEHTRHRSPDERPST
jgi:hypothetical protein